MVDPDYIIFLFFIFIDFRKFSHPTLLFHPACLFTLENLAILHNYSILHVYWLSEIWPSCTIIPSCMIIQETRVHVPNNIFQKILVTPFKLYMKSHSFKPITVARRSLLSKLCFTQRSCGKYAPHFFEKDGDHVYSYEIPNIPFDWVIFWGKSVSDVNCKRNKIELTGKRIANPRHISIKICHNQWSFSGLIIRYMGYLNCRAEDICESIAQETQKSSALIPQKWVFVQSLVETTCTRPFSVRNFIVRQWRSDSSRKLKKLVE